MLSVSRADRGIVAEWWWTVDRLLVAAVIGLMIFGIVFSMAASPPVAQKLGLDQFFFVKRQAVFLIPALVVMFVTSLLDEKQMRRISLLMFVGGLALMVAVLVFGFEVKGSRRWISIAGFALQPSEFVKPAFVVLAAWLFSEGQKNQGVPGAALATGLLAVFAALLLMQPDVGQTFLAAMVWGVLFFLAGMPWLLIAVIGGLGFVAMLLAYTLLPHVTDRVDRFFDPASGDTYQVDTALQSFVRGGWFGRGPGEGTVKQVLPDSHTDFILAVAAEEFGILLCLVVLALFAFVVLRVMYRAFALEDRFQRFAVAGLISLFGLQALINMAVNLQLLPAKGMTLPFISYGGSSLISMSFAIGMVLALTRRRPAAAPPMAFANAGMGSGGRLSGGARLSGSTR